MRLVVYLWALVFLTVSAFAGSVTPGLADYFASRGNSETVPVLISLSDRVAAQATADYLERQGFALSQVHGQVMSSLQGRAASTQGPVLRSLEILESQGMARNVRSLWISNLIAAEVNRAAAELLANMLEVSEVGLDESATLRPALESRAASGSNTTAFATAHISEAWQAGYRGDGRLLCVIADGADVSHPALATRWRGQAASLASSWYEPGNSAAATPCGSEGTLATGLLCGESTGAAPGANWIAARLFCGREVRLTDILLALQWAADPDGRSETTADVPDAICNLWGLASPCLGGAPSAVWEALENVEALGPILVFAASNDGASGAGSVKAPESHDNCLAVGNADGTVLHHASGRGPSPCDPALVKPDITAPGTGLYTTGANGTVQVSGTGPAAALVTGTVALLRQADPNLTAVEIKAILTRSARDAGSSGPDNSFGHGLVDAAGAINTALAMGQTGAVEGVVRYGGTMVGGVCVTLSGSRSTMETTSTNGVFRFDRVQADRNYAIQAGKFGFKYVFRWDSIHVQDGQTASLFLNLERGFDDDAEHDQGWELGVDGDNATGGLWVRERPVAARVGGHLVQPGEDADAYGEFCFVTGNAPATDADARSADVDGGRTTLRSPAFSLAEVSEPELHFFYWYSNDRGTSPGADFFRVQISNDDGRTWTNLINTATSTGAWKKVDVKLAGFVTPTAQMRLQFIAEDAGPGSLVEAAVDDITITGAPAVPEPPRDLTLDVQFNQVVLTWQPSDDAKGYNVYLSGDADHVIAPENLYRKVTETTLVVPMNEIPYNEFFFQVTAAK